MGSEELTRWLTEELKRRGWSHRELARRAGLSQTNISGVVAGQKRATDKFLMKISKALNEPLVSLYRLAGVLPPGPDESDAILDDINQLARALPLEKRKQVRDYIEFLHRQGRE